MDLIEAVREAEVVRRILRAERQDDAVFHALSEKAVIVAAEFDIDASVPRQNPNQRTGQTTLYEIR
ncbi:hypothetical protein DPMN_046213 [Dreissena polymorpha]|uniref:Uncharacterized protein n=1 Tax=Dreissena polymorpha TaxID=45954 RepID=A0A9D4D7G0_DREPO|nr:hypothetical protein DPMN_046213 [Dreissena polymorpha]